MRSRRRAIIVGGGIAGVATGISLRRVGWDIRILERAATLPAGGAGITLGSNAMRALDAVGLGEPVLAAGHVESGVGTRTPSGRWLTRLDSSPLADRSATRTIGIHRADLYRILCAALPDGILELAADVQLVTPGATTAEPAEVRWSSAGSDCAAQADLVVVADGLNSGTRMRLGPDVPAPTYVGTTVWRAVTGLAEVARTGASITWGRGTEFGIFPIGDEQVYWYGAAQAAAGQRHDDELNQVGRLFSLWHQPIPALLGATEPAGVVRDDLYALATPVDGYVRGRAALVGDAAHGMPPYLGQGAAQALEDAVVLAACCNGTPDLHTALRGYDAERRPRTQRVARSAYLMGRYGQQLSNPVAVSVRNLALWIIPAGTAIRPMRWLTDWQPPS